MGRGVVGVRRGSAYEGFNVTHDRDIEVYSGRERRKLRYTLQPDVLKFARKKPEMLDLLYHREVMQWVTRLEREGYTLVSKPTEPTYVVCADWREPRGSKWAIVEAEFYHHGPLGVIRENDMMDFKAYMQSIDAKKMETPAGVAEWLESMDEDAAADAVQRSRPPKEIDDDGLD